MSWTQWSAWFVELFGLSDRQPATVAAWIREVFVPGGASPDELHAAALEVAKGGPPRFLNEILPALLGAVKASRADALLAREEHERDSRATVGPGPCRDCGGSGLASVPQRPEADWARGTLIECYVCCSCAAGLRTGMLRDHRDRPLMTLKAYEQINPGWRNELSYRRKQQLAKARVEGGDGKEWASLMERMLESAKGRARR